MAVAVSYSDAAKSAEHFQQLQAASAQLDEVLGESAGLVTSRWDRKTDARGRVLYTLRLQDPFGEVTGEFSPTELDSHHQIDFRLYRLWGDLLRFQTNKLIQQLAGN